MFLDFNFQNVKLPYESYKGDYATIKYYIKIIIISTFQNAEYEKEFAVVNPYDKSILKKNDEPIRMQVGMKQKMSLSIYFQHKNYNCRGTLKGFIQFNYLNIQLKFMEVQIVRREVVFGDKKCEPAYVARYELIDGVPTKNERIPIRFFLKSYNLTPTYPNIDNVFCVRYFLNLVIADEEDNRYFKQKEICLFRLYKERKNYCNYNNNNIDDEYYNNNYNNEIFITEPIYEEDFSLYYQPAFGGQNNKDDYDDNYGINANMPSINENESYEFGYDINNDGRNRNTNNKNFNNNNRINTFNTRNNIINENNYDNRNRNKNNINKNIENNNNINYNRNKTYNNNNERKNLFNDDYFNDEDDNNFRKNNNNINNDNYNNYNQNRNMNRGKYQNQIINNNSSNYYSITTKNNTNSYNEANMFDDDIDGNNYGLNNINDINDLAKLEKKSSQTSHSHRSNLMQARISSEDDFKNIFNSLDKNANKEELKKNIFG